MLRQIRFQGFRELAFQLTVLVEADTGHRIYTEIRLAPHLLEHYCCVIRVNVCEKSNTLTILNSNN